MTVSVILASKSPSRRNVLRAAGVNPTVSVSRVDEPAALEHEAVVQGRTVESLSAEERVMILAQAKAQKVYDAYRLVAETTLQASGEQVTAFPLQARNDAQMQGDLQAQCDLRESCEGCDGGESGDDAPVDEGTGAVLVSRHTVERSADERAADEQRASDPTLTRDFSGLDIPHISEPLELVVSRDPGFAGADAKVLIVGCDSMFLFDGEAFGKPHTPEVARERLRAMRGKSGELWTGHCVIDLASGRQERAASHATVTFADFTDAEIEAYIASGEPLEVAGCFTLEGLGGAFIESVDGDPSGVLGLSLPLLRRMVSSLGFAWTDLWNTEEALGADARSAVEPNPAVAAATPKAPQGTIRQPGDGWVDCACGRRHWGLNGAAGVLLARRDEQGHVTDVVMQHRAVWSAEGGTWGVPGGAMAVGENPIEGALREAYEEANITPDDVEVVGTHREDHGPWSYTTVFAFEKPGHRVEPRANDNESLTIEWVPVSKVGDLKLLTALRVDWPGFAERLEQLGSR